MIYWILNFKLWRDFRKNSFCARIQNRLYLGNKFKLLDFIWEVVKENCSDVETVADIFSGTRAVASVFSDKTIFTKADLIYINPPYNSRQT